MRFVHFFHAGFFRRAGSVLLLAAGIGIGGLQAAVINYFADPVLAGTNVRVEVLKKQSATLPQVFALVEQQTSRPAATNAVSWVEHRTGGSERLELTLQDGTRITLNANGTIAYPDAFNPYARVVRLSGEAFFDVTADAARPFVVETDSLRITVIGTRFNVRAFPDGKDPEVSIVQGRVQISGLADAEVAPEPTLLVAGQQYTFSPETGKAEVRAIATGNVTRWMQPPVQWQREPLPSALQALEKRFGVPFVITDASLKNETITSRFDAESLEDVLAILQLTGALDLRVERHNDAITRVTVAPGRLSARPGSPAAR